MTDQPRPQGQLDVQRWLGRCMLGLQQYERLMKTLLAHHELAGPADTLEAQRAANLEKVSDKTLGTLVKSLFESYAVPDGFERQLLPEDKVPTDRISMAISYRMTMAPERLAEVRAQIEELVDAHGKAVVELFCLLVENSPEVLPPEWAAVADVIAAEERLWVYPKATVGQIEEEPPEAFMPFLNRKRLAEEWPRLLEHARRVFDCQQSGARFSYQSC